MNKLDTHIVPLAHTRLNYPSEKRRFISPRRSRVADGVHIFDINRLGASSPIFNELEVEEFRKSGDFLLQGVLKKQKPFSQFREKVFRKKLEMEEKELLHSTHADRAERQKIVILQKEFNHQGGFKIKKKVNEVRLLSRLIKEQRLEGIGPMILSNSVSRSQSHRQYSKKRIEKLHSIEAKKTKDRFRETVQNDNIVDGVFSLTRKINQFAKNSKTGSSKPRRRRAISKPRNVQSTNSLVNEPMIDNNFYSSLGFTSSNSIGPLVPFSGYFMLLL